MPPKRSKPNSNSISIYESSKSLVDEDLIISKPDYNQIKDQNIKTIKKLIDSPIDFRDSENISFYNQNQVILSNTSKHKVYKVDLNGKFQHFIGKSKYGKQNGCFYWPRGIFVSKDDRIFIADSSNNRIQIFNGQTGDFQSTFGSFGNQNDQFYQPRSISIDNNDRIFVSDSTNHRIQIFDSTNQWISQIKSNDQSNEDYIQLPTGIIHNSEDYLFVCDMWEKNRVVCFDRNNQFTFDFGSRGSENGQFGGNVPQFISIDRWDQLMISDGGNNRISIHNSDGSFLSNIPINCPFGISASKYGGMIGVLNDPKRELKLIEIDK